jgi:hypothetical protein
MQLATVINDYKQPYGARLRCRQLILQLACYTGFAVDNDHLLSTAESSTGAQKISLLSTASI